MSSSIKWQEPPSDARGENSKHRGKWAQMVDDLKEFPGRWALIIECGSPGSMGALKRKGLEVRSVTAGLNYPIGKYDIYARWPEAETK